MSWSGTVRCGHCYNTGHNKRSCPTLKEFVENNPDSWRAKNHARSAAKGKLRRCTYCNLKGHNRRTCEHLKTDKVEWVTKTREWREGFVEWAAEIGLSPGALIRMPDGYATTAVRIVGGFIWNALHPDAQTSSYPHQGMQIRRLSDPVGLSWTRQSRLPKHDVLVPQQESTIEVVAPVYRSTEDIIALAPEWFMEGTTVEGLNDIFDKDRQHPNHYDNGFEDN